jgi:hypothetical protein
MIWPSRRGAGAGSASTGGEERITRLESFDAVEDKEAERLVEGGWAERDAHPAAKNRRLKATGSRMIFKNGLAFMNARHYTRTLERGQTRRR